MPHPRLSTFPEMVEGAKRYIQKSLRSKTQVKSVLDDIPGVGPARRKALMRHFKSLEEIKNATVEELMELPEMNGKIKPVVMQSRGTLPAMWTRLKVTTIMWWAFHGTE